MHFSSLFCPLLLKNDEAQRWPVVVLFLFSLIFLILAAVFPLDAFKTLYIFDMFTKNVILAQVSPLHAALGCLGGASCGVLGVSWGRLGPPWRVLGCLGAALGRLGVVLGMSWGRLRPPWVALRASWAALGRPGGVLEGFGGVFGCTGAGLGRKYMPNIFCIRRL